MKAKIEELKELERRLTKEYDEAIDRSVEFAREKVRIWKMIKMTRQRLASLIALDEKNTLATEKILGGSRDSNP